MAIDLVKIQGDVVKLVKKQQEVDTLKIQLKKLEDEIKTAKEKLLNDNKEMGDFFKSVKDLFRIPARRSSVKFDKWTFDVKSDPLGVAGDYIDVRSPDGRALKILKKNVSYKKDFYALLNTKLGLRYNLETLSGEAKTFIEHLKSL